MADTIEYTFLNSTTCAYIEQRSFLNLSYQISIKALFIVLK